MYERSHQEALDEDLLQLPCRRERCMLKTFEKDAQSFRKMTVTECLSVLRKALFATAAPAGDNDPLGNKVYNFYLRKRSYRHAEKRKSKETD